MTNPVRRWPSMGYLGGRRSCGLGAPPLCWWVGWLVRRWSVYLEESAATEAGQIDTVVVFLKEETAAVAGTGGAGVAGVLHRWTSRRRAGRSMPKDAGVIYPSGKETYGRLPFGMESRHTGDQ